jgi:type I restriction enzyme R subunit
LQVLIAGGFDQCRLLDLVGHFLVFEDAGHGQLIKKMAGYHQFHAVRVAVAETVRAAGLLAAADARGTWFAQRQHGGQPGDGRVGVVWHTQGSGKSLTMAFYAGRVIREPAMANPTLVVLTDRNDLDDQLFGTFARCQDLLRQPPVQAESRADLREKLRVEAGGVVFTTIQKFMPEEKGDRHPLRSDRRNIVVIADEAHRSQYDFIDGFARHLRDALPNAVFIGFTGTPAERLGLPPAAQVDGKNRGCAPCRSCLRHSPSPSRTRTPWQSATTWPSSRPCERRRPRATRASCAPRSRWSTLCGRSSPVRSRRRA